MVSSSFHEFAAGSLPDEGELPGRVSRLGFDFSQSVARQKYREQPVKKLDKLGRQPCQDRFTTCFRQIFRPSGKPYPGESALVLFIPDETPPESGMGTGTIGVR